MGSSLHFEQFEDIEGLLGVCLVDSTSGVVIKAKTNGFDNLEASAACDSELIRQKRNALQGLNMDQNVEDILICLNHQYHLIRPLASNQDFFVYLILDRAQANLAMARLQLKNYDDTVILS